MTGLFPQAPFQQQAAPQSLGMDMRHPLSAWQPSPPSGGSSWATPAWNNSSPWTMCNQQQANNEPIDPGAIFSQRTPFMGGGGNQPNTGQGGLFGALSGMSWPNGTPWGQPFSGYAGHMPTNPFGWNVG
jgi:hypothetical protein